MCFPLGLEALRYLTSNTVSLPPLDICPASTLLPCLPGGISQPSPQEKFMPHDTQSTFIRAGEGVNTEYLKGGRSGVSREDPNHRALGGH